MKRMRKLVSRTERAPSQSQRLAEELRALRFLAAVRERDRQVRREQLGFVLRVEHASRGDEDLTLDLRGFGVLAHDHRCFGVPALP